MRRAFALTVLLGAAAALQPSIAAAQDNPFDSPDLKSALLNSDFSNALSAETPVAVSEYLADDVKVRGFREFLNPQGAAKAEAEVLDKQGFLSAFSSRLDGPRRLCVPSLSAQGAVVSALVRVTTDAGFGCSGGTPQIVTWEWSADKVKWLNFAPQLVVVTGANPGPGNEAKVK